MQNYLQFVIARFANCSICKYNWLASMAFFNATEKMDDDGQDDEEKRKVMVKSASTA